MRNLNLENVQEAQEFKRVVPGAYICKITNAVDVIDEHGNHKEYLGIEYDIAEGELKGYYKELFDAKSFWGGKFIKSYKEKALPFFKAFVTSIEKSNPNYKFDNDEKKLAGKLVGLVIAEEEYKKNDGTVGNRLYVASVRSVEEVRKGGIEIPALKRLAGFEQQATAFSQMDLNEDELPF